MKLTHLILSSALRSKNCSHGIDQEAEAQTTEVTAGKRQGWEKTASGWAPEWFLTRHDVLGKTLSRGPAHGRGSENGDFSHEPPSGRSQLFTSWPSACQVGKLGWGSRPGVLANLLGHLRSPELVVYRQYRLSPPHLAWDLAGGRLCARRRCRQGRGSGGD